jgi:hypothetical protein
LEKGDGKQIVVKPPSSVTTRAGDASQGAFIRNCRLSPWGSTNFVEIVREKEYSFSKYLPVPLLSLAGGDERGSRGLSLVQKGYLLWIKKEF